MKKAKLICAILAFTTVLAVGCSTNKDKSKVTTNINNSSSTKQNQENKETDDSSTKTGEQKEKTSDEQDSSSTKINADSKTIKSKDKSSIQASVTTDSAVTLALFIPNGNYEVKYSGSDLADNIEYIKGNGTTYETIGNNGKGAFVKVYTTDSEGMYGVYSGDLTEQEMKNKSSIDYLSKVNNLEKDYLLEGPIEVGTRWGNKEIVEVGQDLKLGDLSLEGTYVKTWERKDGKEGNVIKVHYYSQGLGCVDYRSMIDDQVVERFTLTSYEKK